jgi:hypothetical protein
MNTLLPTTDYYFTNTLRKYACTIKNSIDTDLGRASSVEYQLVPYGSDSRLLTLT